MILSFELTMPNVGSWNGKWTGAEWPYFRCRTLSKKDGEKFMQEKTNARCRNFYYNFRDGWGANVEVKVIDSYTRRKLEKITEGFCGYEWMIDSILKYDKIMTSRD